MRLAGVLLTFLLISPAALAQPSGISVQENERARELLNSPKLTEKAWGVYLASRLRSDDFDERLIELFRAGSAFRDLPGYTEEHAFITVLFDAAIEDGIAIPTALLQPFEEEWIDPVIILLARNNDAEEPLLRLRAYKSRDVVWLAANNLLCARRSQPWYEAILHEVTITHRFTVVDNISGPRHGEGQGGGSYSDGGGVMPNGFPPVTLYTLQDWAAPGSVLLAPGPRNVFYKRTILPTGKQVAIGTSGSTLDRMAARIEYLAELHNSSILDTQKLFRAATQICYINTEAFDREVDRSLQAQREGIRAFITDLQRKGLTARGADLHIFPELVDSRDRPAESLPLITPRQIDLQ